MKFILSLPFQTDISYPERLAKVNILPITYWHEYLDLVYLFKCIYENSNKNVKLNSPNRVTRRSGSTSIRTPSSDYQIKNSNLSKQFLYQSMQNMEHSTNIFKKLNFIVFV
jgi:hypothetical protein